MKGKPLWCLGLALGAGVIVTDPAGLAVNCAFYRSMDTDYRGHLDGKGEEVMMKDRIWLISAITCFVAAVVLLAGSAIGIPDTLVRIFGVINVVSLLTVVYRTVRNKK